MIAGNGITTRSGRSILPPGSPVGVRSAVADKTRVQKSPRARRRTKPAKTGKGAATPNITAPLSVLTKDMTHIPVKDMEAWVNRPIEVRRREVAQKNGKIARPMNSFMLYRSAYADRTKEWCAQNNHQVVSRASGQSWPLEPPEIREKFELLAIIERDNHQKAHPEYKFAPNKTQTPPRKKRSIEEDDSSDIDEAEFDIQSTSPPHPKRARSSEVDSCYESRESTPFDSQGSVLSDSFNQSPWKINTHNANRPIPGLMSPPEQTFYYPQHGMQPSMMRSHVEDAPFPKPGFAGGYYNASATLAGIPGHIHHDLLRSYPTVATPPQIDDSQLDPQLLAVDNTVVDVAARPFSNCQYTLWQSEHELNSFAPLPSPLGPNPVPFDIGLPNYAGVQTLEDGHSFWNLSNEEGIGEAGKEFDQWLNSQTTAF
ncbi:hypothetical protein VTN77DRAFT_6674 [Rasamsonia byssochlamydoides]|uniref:uncharacterized protein n=1 Tax=Rasamsonia byssochlamydoides TaxID=89139 RepID=UPI0037424283